MKINSNFIVNGKWVNEFDLSLNSSNTLILIFSQLTKPKSQKHIDQIQEHYPDSIIIGCSTAGQILEGELIESELSATIVKFESSQLIKSSVSIDSAKQSKDKGAELAQKLMEQEGLRNVFILSEGLNINGSQLIAGFNQHLDEGICVSGGLAGDDDRFETTWVIDQNNQAAINTIIAVGIYGENIRSSHASKGGWDMIGVDRLVTKSEDHILYEIDNKPALEIYKQYLGEYAENLPASGLLFPLALIDENDENLNKVRTILSVNHEENSITFAGDIPTGSMVRLMHANFDRIIDGAGLAAEELTNQVSQISSECLCLSISCVGRKLILGQRVYEEIEAVNEYVPEKGTQTGFYSYGELSPLAKGKCDLHNQTMTLTLFWEA